MEKMAEKRIKLPSNANHVGHSSAYLYGHGPLRVHMLQRETIRDAPATDASDARHITDDCYADCKFIFKMYAAKVIKDPLSEEARQAG